MDALAEVVSARLRRVLKEAARAQDTPPRVSWAARRSLTSTRGPGANSTIGLTPLAPDPAVPAALDFLTDLFTVAGTSALCSVPVANGLPAASSAFSNPAINPDTPSCTAVVEAVSPFFSGAETPLSTETGAATC